MRLALEGKLQENGIRIRSGTGLAAVQETPRVLIDVGALTIDSAYFFSVSLELIEPVRLKRSGVEHYAVSWQRQVMGAAPLSSAAAATWEAANRLLGAFLEARRRTTLSDAGPATGVSKAVPDRAPGTW
jgi:hypothetical protein